MTPSFTSLLQQHSDLLEQIDLVTSNISTLRVAMTDIQSQSSTLEKDRRKLAYDLSEIDKSLIQAICPTDEAFRRFRNSVLRFAQSSSEG